MTDMQKLQSIIEDLTRRSQEFHNADIVCIGYVQGCGWWSRTAFAFPTRHYGRDLFYALDLLEQEIRGREEYNRMGEAAQ